MREKLPIHVACRLAAATSRRSLFWERPDTEANAYNGTQMGSDRAFVEFVVDQLDDDCGVTFKKMFGEYGLFSGGKMFGMICDDRLLFKPTEGGRAFIGEVVEAEPYPGAKPIFLIEEQVEDGEWLSELVRITTRELPAPRSKKRKKPQAE